MQRSVSVLFILTIILGLWQPVAARASYSAIAGNPGARDRQDAAMAEDDIVACADDPFPNMNGQDPGFAGKPVNLRSGAETFTRTDLTIGSLFPIAISRRYNGGSGYDSPLGYGWASNYDRRIYTYPDGSVTLRKECGWKKRFTWSVGGYINPLGETGTLVQNADGSFTYTYKNGDKDIYDARGRLVGRIDSKGNSVVITYMSLTRDPLWGLLLYNVNQSGSLIVAYDYHLNKIEEKDASGTLTGASVTFAYDTSTGRLNGIWDSVGRSITYSHDNIGNLTGVSGPSGNMSYGYNDANNSHRMTSIDEGRGVYENTYDAKGRVSRQTRGTGVIDFIYDTLNKKTTITTAIRDSSANVLNTQTRTSEFDANGQVSRVTDTYGNVTTYARDGGILVTHEELWENVGTVSSPNLVLRTATSFTYDAKGNMLTKTEALGSSIEKTTAYTHHPTFSKVLTETVASVVNPSQTRVIINTYDDTYGNLLTTTDTGFLGNGAPYSFTTTYTYNGNGNISSIDGPRTDVSDVTTYAYDMAGNLMSITQPLVGTTTYSNHDALGNPQTVTDPNGNSTTYTYDQTGRVTSVKAPGDTNPTQYFYVSGGCTSCGGGNKIDHITLPEGNTIWYTYDSMGNLITIKDSLNNTINYTYDSEGNKLTEQIKDASGALQKSLSYQYDALNQLSKIVNPDSSFTQYEYDFRGNRRSFKAPQRTAAEKTVYSFDSLNRLAIVSQPGNTTTYGYNTNANLTSVTDANTNTTQYKYDDKGRVYQTIFPDTGTTTYGYDPAGNMISKTDAKGVTTSYVYDATNRLTKIDFPTDTDIIYAYDSCPNGKGRLCSMTDASGSTVYEYTPKGQVKTETKTIDSVQYVTQYTYDQNGNLKTMTYPSGRVITYNMSNDRVTSVLNNAANLATNINYKPFGNVSSITYGNGLTGAISYDNQYRITSMVAGVVMNLSYDQYDANANIQHITNTLDPTKNKTFGYDALDRLASATGSWGSLGWTYDGVGNRQTENGNAYTYITGSNKLSAANGLSYGFDSNGNTTTEGAKQYTYNQNQRLIQAVNGATTANYTYNGNGQRVKKVVNGAVTIFHYSLTGQLIAESNSAGTITAEYVYLNGQPLAKIEGASTYFCHNDHLGTPQKMTDASGTVVWAADYKPFGEATITVSTITNNLRGAGQYFDAETGTLYNYFRDYDPTIGKYKQADPLNRGMLQLTFRDEVGEIVNYFIVSPNSQHLYNYVKNNPINLIDPFGLEESSVDAAIKQAIARGDVTELETILDATGNQAARAGLNRLRTKAADLIGRECKGSINRVFPQEMLDQTLEEIIRLARMGVPAAQTAKKLLTDLRFKK